MSDNEDQSVAAYSAEVNEFRRQKDQFFATSAQSPIPRELRAAGFTGLRYYPPDLTYRVEAELVPFDEPEIVPLGTTQGEIRRHIRYGELRFTILGEEGRLVAFKSADEPGSNELFVPFKDSTSGADTYGAGRYIETEDESSERAPHPVIIDFNLAYNPWCAYNVAYSCTLPPAENRLTIPIMAGELIFPVDH